MQPVETPYVELQGNGVLDELAFNFHLDDVGQLRVRQITYDDDGNLVSVVTLSLGGDYTVTLLPRNSADGDLVPPGGTINLAVAPDDNQKIYADRVTALNQPTVFPTSGPLNLRTLEQRLDYLTRIVQEQQTDIMRIPVGDDPTASPVAWFATPSDWGKYASLDSFGNPVFTIQTALTGGISLSENIAGRMVFFGGPDILQGAEGATYDPSTGITSIAEIIVGDPGTEGDGINVGGSTFNSTLKVSDIGGANLAQTILHRHSTTLEPVIVMARSNSDTPSHADVTNGQPLGTVFGVGWAGSNYKIFGYITIGVDDSGTVSNTSAPGCLKFFVTPDGSTTPVQILKIANDGTVSLTQPVAERAVQKLASVHADGNAEEIVYQNTVETNNSNPLPLITIPVPEGEAIGMDIFVTAKRNGSQRTLAARITACAVNISGTVTASSNVVDVANGPKPVEDVAIGVSGTNIVVVCKFTAKVANVRTTARVYPCG